MKTNRALAGLISPPAPPARPPEPSTTHLLANTPPSLEQALLDKATHVPVRVLECLRKATGELSAQDIADRLGIAVQTARNNLSPLVVAGAVVARKTPKMKMYRIRPLAEQQTNKAA